MLNPSTSKSQYRSLYTGPSNASYSLSKASRECTSILKRFHALFLPLCTLIQCLVIAMPPQSLKIDHLPSDASAILRERYLAGTFSVVTQWLRFLTNTVTLKMLWGGNVMRWNVAIHYWSIWPLCIMHKDAVAKPLNHISMAWCKATANRNSRALAMGTLQCRNKPSICSFRYSPNTC